MWFAVDADDPTLEAYSKAVLGTGASVMICEATPTGMVAALNASVRDWLQSADAPTAIGFMGDDHRPRTRGWDAAYLTALRSLPGFVYGNDLVQGVRLPTQVAISTPVVRALGHMAPPTLRHMYVDNYWLRLGQAAACITYLRNVVVEHLHPVAGTAAWDAGYRRVNAREVYDQDRKAFEAYMSEHGHRETLAVIQAAAAVPK
ncbi:hypothetical protein [Spongiactinospora gelatinilytica]|uniref:hypothetical protein n=1 Tax=Spongiactinospora gelatinilytica TaxID=2666298 RepID=UPI000DA6E898|nr:hypothetical protein [Spongiactinospora gelatinilytica]